MSWVQKIKQSKLLKPYVHRSSMLVIIVAVTIWLVASMILYLLAKWKGMTFMGQVGDSFGVVNSLTTLITFAALWISIRMQREEFLTTKEELAYSRRQAHKDSFETTFFNMIESMRHQAAEYSLQYSAETELKGSDAFNKIYQLLEKRFAGLQESNDFETISHNWIHTTTTLEHYFLSLDVLLKHVNKFAKQDVNIRNEYHEIIASNLTRTQAGILWIGVKFNQFPKDRGVRIKELLDIIEKNQA